MVVRYYVSVSAYARYMEWRFTLNIIKLMKTFMDLMTRTSFESENISVTCH